MEVQSHSYTSNIQKAETAYAFGKIFTSDNGQYFSIVLHTREKHLPHALLIDY